MRLGEAGWWRKAALGPVSPRYSNGEALATRGPRVIETGAGGIGALCQGMRGQQPDPAPAGRTKRPASCMSGHGSASAAVAPQNFPLGPALGTEVPHGGCASPHRSLGIGGGCRGGARAAPWCPEKKVLGSGPGLSLQPAAVPRLPDGSTRTCPDRRGHGSSQVTATQPGAAATCAAATSAPQRFALTGVIH